MRYLVKDDQVVVYSAGRDLDDDGGVLPSIAEAILPPPTDHDEDHWQSEERLQHNHILESGTPVKRRARLNKVVSPSPRIVVRGPQREESAVPPDGDWVLWNSAGWPVERNQ